MASTKEYLDFVMEQLSGLDEISSRTMMGEYILYYHGRIFGGIYDDRLLVKLVPMALRLMPDAEMERPYDGAKEMILVDNVEVGATQIVQDLEGIGFIVVTFGQEYKDISPLTKELIKGTLKGRFFYGSYTVLRWQCNSCF